jgi:hypothetical protein
MTDIPTLSSREIRTIARVLEARLTDVCFLLTANSTTTAPMRIYGSSVLSVEDGANVTETTSFYYVNSATYTGTWGDEIPCRVISTGTSSKLADNSTVYTTGIELEVKVSEAITPVYVYPPEPSATAADGVYLYGTWVAYNNNIYRVTGINEADTVPTVQRVTAELDYSSLDTFYGAGLYPRAGSAIAAEIGFPVFGKRIITDAGLVLGTVSGKYFVTKG